MKRQQALRKDWNYEKILLPELLLLFVRIIKAEVELFLRN